MYVSFRCIKTGNLRLVNLRRVEYISCKDTYIRIYFNHGDIYYSYKTIEEAQKMYKSILEGIQKDSKLVFDIDEKELK